MIKYSIIIPIYGVEAYIGKALDSIYSQGLSDEEFEVIAVNDETPDDSMKVVESYKKVHANIVVINQKNSGVSVARNKGINAAKGKYITFLDPDDWLAPNSFKEFEKQNLNDCESDIIVLQSDMEGQEVSPFGNIIKKGSNLSGLELFDLGFARYSVCGGFYKRTFLNENEIYFADGVTNAEDTIFFALCLAHNANIRFAQIPFYNVFVRQGSASRHKFTVTELCNKYKRALNALMLETNKWKGLPKKNLGVLEYYRYVIISNLINNSIKYGATYNELCKNIRLSNYLPIHHNYIPMKKSKILMLNFSLPLFFLIAKIKK